MFSRWVSQVYWVMLDMRWLRQFSHFFLLAIGAGPAALGLIEGFSDCESSIVKSFAGYLNDKMGKRSQLVQNYETRK